MRYFKLKVLLKSKEKNFLIDKNIFKMKQMKTI
jgi:hypothetical protein